MLKNSNFTLQIQKGSMILYSMLEAFYQVIWIQELICLTLIHPNELTRMKEILDSDLTISNKDTRERDLLIAFVGIKHDYYLMGL